MWHVCGTASADVPRRLRVCWSACRFVSLSGGLCRGMPPDVRPGARLVPGPRSGLRGRRNCSHESWLPGQRDFWGCWCLIWRVPRLFLRLCGHDEIRPSRRTGDVDGRPAAAWAAASPAGPGRISWRRTRIISASGCAAAIGIAIRSWFTSTTTGSCRAGPRSSARCLCCTPGRRRRTEPGGVRIPTCKR